MNKHYFKFFLPILSLMAFCLISCSADSHQTQPESVAAIDLETQTLMNVPPVSAAPDLDQLLSDFEFPPISTSGINLQPEEKLNAIPPELAMQLAKAVCTERSVTLIKEMNQPDLMITPQDFTFDPVSNDDTAPHVKNLQKSLQSADPGLDLYQCDLDSDGIDEIIAITNKKYEYSHSNTAYLLKRTGDKYILTGYDYLSYYRCFSIFSYEGKYYLATNYDNYETKTTKAAGLFLLNGDESGFMWLIHKPQEGSDLFLLDARICPDTETTVLMDYVIRPEPVVTASDYWDYDDSNLMQNEYEDPDFELAFPDNLRDEAAQFALEVQGDFVPDDYEDTVIPSELITAAQQALFDRTPHEPELTYTSPEIDRDVFYSSSLYDKNEYHDPTAEHIYKYELGQNSYYLFVTDSGGTARFVDITICQEFEEKLEFIDNIVSLDLDARVIEYQDNFYLLESSYNYYSKYTDSVAIYQLTPQGFGHCVSISQNPSSHEHELIYENAGDHTQTITNYVTSVMDDVISASPINDNIYLYTGAETLINDDEKSPRLKSVGEDYDYYEIDFNNDGQPEYISRHYWYPSNSLCLFLISNLYQFTPTRIEELDCELSNGYGELVQVWFKELDDKIFTFRLFAFQDKYVLNVSLIEGTQISQLQTWLIVPQNKFSTTSRE